MPTLHELVMSDKAYHTWHGVKYRDYLDGTDVLEAGDTCAMRFLEDDKEAPDLYAFPDTLWGDYVGDTVTRSNHRSLLRDYPNVFVVAEGSPGASELYLRADYAGEDVEDLYRIGTELVDSYPLYDEEDHGTLEYELADEAWEAYLKWDVLRDLARAGVENADAIDEGELHDRFYEFVSGSPEPFHGEGADDVVFPYYDAAIQVLAEFFGRRDA